MKKIKKCTLCDNAEYYENENGQIIHGCTQFTLFNSSVIFYEIVKNEYKLLENTSYENLQNHSKIDSARINKG